MTFQTFCAQRDEVRRPMNLMTSCKSIRKSSKQNQMKMEVKRGKESTTPMMMNIQDRPKCAHARLPLYLAQPTKFRQVIVNWNFNSKKETICKNRIRSFVSDDLKAELTSSGYVSMSSSNSDVSLQKSSEKSPNEGTQTVSSSKADASSGCTCCGNKNHTISFHLGRRLDH